MIFKKVVLNNFRPYYGTKEFEFCYGEKNITLIKAENGSGKTTLLEAIKWGLYGGKDLDLAEGKSSNGAISFVNKKRIAEATKTNEDINACVEIEFEEEGNDYVIKRNISFKKNKIEIEVELKENGKLIKDSLIENTIEKILPKEINFFVDGERLDRIAPLENEALSIKKESRNEIRESIFRILGIKSLQNAVDDIKEIQKEIDKEYLDDGEVSSELKKHYNNLESLKDTLESQKRQINDITDEINDLILQKQNLNKTLDDLRLAIDTSSKQQERYNTLVKDKIEAEKSYEKKLNDYKRFLAKNSWKELSKVFFQKSISVLEKHKVDGVIPSKYEKEFLEELLEKKLCICGCLLERDSTQYNNIINKVKNASTRIDRDKFNDCYYMFKELLTDHIKSQRIELKKEVADLKNLLIEQEIEIKTLEENVLSQSQIEEQNKILQNLEEIDKDEKELHRKLGALESKNISLKTEIDSLQKVINGQEKKRVGNLIIRKEKLFCQKIYNNLLQLKKYKENQGRIELTKKIEEVYKKVNGKSYEVIIDEYFNFEIYDFDGNKAGISKGESKNKALSFVGGLVYYAKELTKNRNNSDINKADGGIYPLVLDAPYGDLDNSYRKEFTSFLPFLSEQIIVMVSSGQWNDEIENLIKNNIGITYDLINARRDNGDIKYDITEIRRI